MKLGENWYWLLIVEIMTLVLSKTGAGKQRFDGGILLRNDIRWNIFRKVLKAWSLS